MGAVSLSATLRATSGALRGQIHRRRKRERIVVGGRRPEIPEHVRAALVERGWLTPGQALDPKALVDVSEEILDCWARGTLTCGPINRP